jgi:hypothetical protein
LSLKSPVVLIAGLFVHRVSDRQALDAIDDWLEQTLVPGYSKSLNSQG